MRFKNKAIWYVYELADPVTGVAFYIGKGKGSRLHNHEKEALRGVCSKKCNKIRSIINSGNNIIKRKVAMFWCEQAAYDYETDLIAHYGLDNLTNIMPGGQIAFQRRVKEKSARTGKFLDPKKLLENNPHIVSHWLRITENGKYKVKAIKTGAPLQDSISKMAEIVYNNCIGKVIEEAFKENKRGAIIGSA